MKRVLGWLDVFELKVRNTGIVLTPWVHIVLLQAYRQRNQWLQEELVEVSLSIKMVVRI